MIVIIIIIIIIIIITITITIINLLTSRPPQASSFILIIFSSLLLLLIPPPPPPHHDHHPVFSPHALIICFIFMLTFNTGTRRKNASYVTALPRLGTRGVKRCGFLSIATEGAGLAPWRDLPQAAGYKHHLSQAGRCGMPQLDSKGP
eukprot:6084238-Pyramimonas_sp.AAC.1